MGSLPKYEEMSQPGNKDLRARFTEGNSSAGTSGPMVKKLRVAKKAAGTPTKSPAKGKDQTPAPQAKVPPPPVAMEKMPPHPPRTPAFVRDMEMEPGTLVAVATEVRIPVDPQALEKIPDVFRGTVYETATYTVDHYFGATERDLRAIETRSPESVMESSPGMALTGALALHRSISRSKARLEDMRGKYQAVLTAHQMTLAALQAAQQQEKEAKDAMAALQAELDAARPKLQEAEATKAALAAVMAELDSTKTGAEEAKAALATEKEASSSAMEDMLYHCWVFNSDDDFSFLGVDWEDFREGFKAHLQQEAPSETREASTVAEQEGETATSMEQPGGA
ncbi:uncharacterized protein LOC133829260 [Humulus lupulus]|uniref:uncharacterized protein LOC133829260 n=1 Tax=Humulus lupulus TaxID=3486 RepID=UPI002B4072A7|nr:uncharacterized protein LOC133829260 [Humulus lupulus]